MAAPANDADTPDDLQDAPVGRFVHLDVATAYSQYCSPSPPEDYIRALGRQYPITPASDAQPRPSIAIADYGLHSAVKTAVACDRAGINHIVGLRLRVVPERAYHAWGERAGELIVLAMDESGWLSLVGLANRGFLGGADRGRPRVDLRDLETYHEGLIALTGMPGGDGLLSGAIENSTDPAEPIEAYGLVRRLMELYPNRLYLELAFHGHAAEKLVNRGLVAIAQRMELPLVATNAVRFVRPEDALSHKLLEAIGHGSIANGILGHSGRDGFDLPTLTIEAARAQAYLKTPKQMWRAFSQLPAALNATLEIAERCKFRLPLVRSRLTDPANPPLGPGLLFGLEPARELGEQQLEALVERALPERCAQSGRGVPTQDVLDRARDEVRTICERGLADLLLFAHEVGQFCAQHHIPVGARGSATASLVVWALGLSHLCPLDYDLDGRMFVHKGREDLPDLDLEVSSLHEQALATFVQQGGFEGLPAHAAGEFPHLRAVRVGVHVSMGARQAVRAVGGALGMEPPRVNTVARQVPVLSSPGAIDNVLLHAPELGMPEVGAGVEPYNTLVQVAGRLEGLPHRYGAHPSAYTFSFYGPGALDWLPAQWVSAGSPGKRRTFGAARHLAVVAEARAEAASLAHPAALASNLQSPAWPLDRDGDAAATGDLIDGGGPLIALQWTKDDLEALGLVRLDISPSAPMATVGVEVQMDDATQAAAWRLLEAGDTLGISQVESLGIRMLLKHAHQLADFHSSDGRGLRSVEDLAQLLALWKPGVYRKEREESYLNARFVARERPGYPHPAMAPVLDPTFGHVLYADQLVDLVKLFDFDHAWAERFRRAIGVGPSGGRDVMERAIREAGVRLGWSLEQSNALIGLVIEHVGYLHLHGHALAMAQHVFRQACLKVNPITAARFFAEVLNNGGSTQYGLGSAVEEARRFGLLLLPPCVNRSYDRFSVVDDQSEAVPSDEDRAHRGALGAIRVPLTAIRGLGPQAAQHILAARRAFGPFTSLLDFCRKVDRRLVSRHDLLLLIKLGSFEFTGLSRSQLAAAEQAYTSLADSVRAADVDATELATLEHELRSATLRYVPTAEWSPETVAAYELAHLGFYTASPHEVERHAKRLTEEFGVTRIAELVDHPDHASASVGAVVTSLRLRLTRKGEKMAWLTLADATGAIEAAVFPQAFARLVEAPRGEFPLREGAFLVARGRLSQEEATGAKLFIDEIVRVHPGAWRSALVVAIEESADAWSVSDLGRAS